VGVELTLLYAIINKMCGPYGLLSLLTGHPINFVQWFYFLTSTVVLVFFLVGFRSVHHPNINTFSLVIMIYFIDTFSGCIFTAYFIWFWFTNETKASEGSENTASSDSSKSSNVGNDAVDEVIKLVKRVSDDLSSQSASESYELFMTVILTLLTTVFRFYFLLIMLSFFKQMVLQSKYNSRFRLSTSPTSAGKFAVVLNKVEVHCYNFLNRLVR